MAGPKGLTVTEAVARYDVTERTIRRRLAARRADDGILPNAQRDGTGRWFIPETDLVKAGISLRTAPVISEPDPLAGPSPDSESTEEPGPREGWRIRAEVAEALLTEVRERLADKDRIIEAKDRESAALLGQIELLVGQLQ